MTKNIDYGIIISDRVRYVLSNMTRDELLRLRLSIEGDMGNIDNQLASRKRDVDWARRAKASRAIKGRQIQAIQAELTRRKDRYEFLRCFYEACKDELDESVFAKLEGLAAEWANYNLFHG